MSEENGPVRLRPADPFQRRHLGPRPEAIAKMLERVGAASLDELVDRAVPRDIHTARPLDIPAARTDREALADLRRMAEENEVWRSYIGLGYHGTILPPLIQRTVLENPGWYTQYTPYQAEISQGRLEALLNFQTVIADLTGLPLANASLLDEATAAAEAMAMCHSIAAGDRRRFFAAADCHPQTLAVLTTRAEPIGIDLVIDAPERLDTGDEELCGALLQYPNTSGELHDHRHLASRLHRNGSLVVAATDPLALTLIAPPGEWGADIAVGSAQRFGVPMGLGGPHAGFLSTHDEHARQLPGRLVGVSRDASGRPALRLALQTREQHIRRQRATSNICTAQVLLAVIASMYAVYHGPDGLRRIARRVHAATAILAAAVRRCGHEITAETWFDTLRIRLRGLDSDAVHARAAERRINLRGFDDGSVGVSLDETVSRRDLRDLVACFEVDGVDLPELDELDAETALPEPFERSSDFLTNEVFHEHRSEHEMLRYIKRLEGRDLSLAHSMIPLGSCTMKLNAAAEMQPISWPEFAELHPFAPREQWRGYDRLFDDLRDWLGEITGYPTVSLQPNAGSQGEYAGLLAIRAYHRSRGDLKRDICLIPTSAHGTNPASAVMAGMRVVPVECDDEGNIDLDDLERQTAGHADELAALMITYPSTHGVFEATVKRVCAAVHEHGGQVYLDGANMNAMVGLVRPAELGADVCHLNLHKTFCIPHGGGGPGMGPIGVAEHLAPFLPTHPLVECGGEQSFGTVAAAPFGSPSILPITWMYVAMMGAEGLAEATRVAILNANYMVSRLCHHYPILYTGPEGLVAHEFILDLRSFKEVGVSVDDVAKRLIDYGFHAPTMSWPVAGTMMVEPTESESKDEIDRLCDAFIAIREEIRELEDGRANAEMNLLREAPHTADSIATDEWDRPYGRERAVFPVAWVRETKFWPPVRRVDNAYGDRNLACTCDSVEAYAAAGA